MCIDYNKENILKEIESKIIGRNVLFFEKIKSTNDYVKEFFYELDHGTVVIARSQTKGRGRRGVSWENGKNDSIFMSILLKQKLKNNDVLNLSHICSLSVLNVVKQLDKDINIKIKWPNDIVIGDKKVCGILTECICNDKNTALVLGIGINVKNRRFSEKIENKATSLYMNDIDVDMCKVVARVLENVEKNYYSYLQYGFKFFIDDYRKNCCNIDNDVVIINDSEKIIGKVIDINIDGSLKFKDKLGVISDVHSNEVSVRGLMGYV